LYGSVQVVQQKSGHGNQGSLWVFVAGGQSYRSNHTAVCWHIFQGVASQLGRTGHTDCGMIFKAEVGDCCGCLQVILTCVSLASKCITVVAFVLPEAE
jgi:hypothetical protein